MDLKSVTESLRIKYIGDSWAYGGEYTLYKTESTYKDIANCPEDEKGTFLIVEFMNDGTPMFIDTRQLIDSEWELV